MSKEIKINKKLEEVVPHLKEEDYIALRNSIKEKGLLKPMDVMKDGTIIDGHHRFKACRELKIKDEDILTNILPNVKTIEDALTYSFDINFARRQLTDFEKMVWQNNVLQLQHDEETQRKIADKLGMDVAQVNRIQKVLDNTPQPIIEKIKNEKIGWTRVHQFLEDVAEVSNEDKKQELIKEFKEFDMDSKSIESLIERCKPEIVKEIKEAKLIQYNALVKYFKSKEEAEQFFKEHGGYLIDELPTYYGMILDTHIARAKQELGTKYSGE